MPLPAHIQNGLYIIGVGKIRTNLMQKQTHTTITGNNVKLQQARANCVYMTGPGRNNPGLFVADFPTRNFVLVDNITNGVAIGNVPVGTTATHVYSDKFGGCQWHIVSDDNHNAAFLHVYRGGNFKNGVPYNLNGWHHRQTFHSRDAVRVLSANFTQQVTGTLAAYSYRPGGSNQVEFCWLVQNQHGMVTNFLGHQTVAV